MAIVQELHHSAPHTTLCESNAQYGSTLSALSIPEIIEMVVDLFHDDKTTLASCAAVARMWLPRSRFYLFRTIQIIIRTPDRHLNAAAAFFCATPSVCGYVQHLHIRSSTTMKLPFAGLDEPEGVWPIPQNGTDLRQMCLLLGSFPNPLSVDLEGVYMALDVPTLQDHMEMLKVTSLRKLIMREVLVPSPAFACFRNLTNIFPALEELSIVSVIFDTASIVAGRERPPPYGGDLNVTNLLLRHVSGILNLFPSTVFRNVTHLNMPMLSLLIPDAARFLIPLYDTLEEMTLAVGQFGLHDIGRNTFDISSCSRLHSLHFIQLGTPTEPEMAALYMVNVNACLRVAPSHLRHVTIGLLPYPDRSMSQFVLSAPSWDVTQDILRHDPLKTLHTLRVAVIPDFGNYLKKIDEVVEYQTLAPQSQELLKSRFKRDVLGKLVF